jgi:hypothetical protein
VRLWCIHRGALPSDNVPNFSFVKGDEVVKLTPSWKLNLGKG